MEKYKTLGEKMDMQKWSIMSGFSFLLYYCLINILN